MYARLRTDSQPTTLSDGNGTPWSGSAKCVAKGSIMTLRIMARLGERLCREGTNVGDSGSRRMRALCGRSHAPAACMRMPW
jgi:hypothetical protein